MGFRFADDRGDFLLSAGLDVPHQVVQAFGGRVAGRADDGHLQARALNVVLDAVPYQGRGDRGGEDTAHDPAQGHRFGREQEACRHG
ncbi:MAG: hypothetical protein AN484_15325 [Aphanizomenon flos-aquae WA102]|uniref:Uncharacterized protein n=1 Tax=Aphanizomenon flos-aquae WA102 TaxID=1710896 RepID=A0A1B7X0F6_APHFL|nr:MAG: hypothetical protein AN484_15325 [Aphanizomenon flos-aquae WA102]